MAKTRRDPKGRALKKGETYISSRRMYCFTYTDPLGKRRYVYSVNLIDLREKEQNIKRDSLDGIDSYASSKCTLDYLFERYIATKTELRSSTRSNYIYTYNRYIKGMLGKKKIGEMKYSDFKYFYSCYAAKGLSLNTISGMNKILSAMFKLAVRDDVIRRSPVDGAFTEVKKGIKERGVRHALTLAEEEAFLTHLEQPKYHRWKPLFIFLFGTGCRIGEAIGIRWDDVDFDTGEVDINHDVTYCPREADGFRCSYEVGPPKTMAGIRVVPLMSKVKEVLLEERDLQEQYGLHNSAVVDGMHGFIFCNRFGGLHKPSSINRAIKRIVDDYNSREAVSASREKRDPLMLPYFSCHVTRHTFCSRLCENGTNIKLIQQIMGHSDIRTTMDIYAEVTKEKTRSVFQDLNEEDVL